MNKTNNYMGREMFTTVDEKRDIQRICVIRLQR